MSAVPVPLLVVEDSPVYAEILQRLLPTLGADLQFASKWVDTAEKAVAEISRGNYTLVLLDYKLPGADGLTVLAHIRSLPPARQPAETQSAAAIAHGTRVRHTPSRAR